MNLFHKHPLLKHGILFFFFCAVFFFVVNAGYVPIPTSIDNALQVIKRILVTDDGTQSGATIMDINTGGAVVVYGSLMDAGLHPYITGYSETDPIRNTQKSNYYTKTQIDSEGFLDAETDPFWTLDKPKYYTTGQIHALGYITGFTEMDAVFLGSDAAGITSTKISHRDTAYGRGNHALMSYLTGETDPDWNADKESYYDKTSVDNLIAGIAGALTYRGGWDYSTGLLPSDVETGDLYVITNPDPADFNGLHMKSPDQIIANKVVVGATSTGDWDLVENDYTETDPVFGASPANSVTNLKLSHRDTAYSRGNHASMGYLTGESDPVWNADKANYYTKTAIDTKGYLTTYTETDPVFDASAAKNITNTNISNWNTAYGRGNHRLMGYLTGETDSLFSASAAATITGGMITHWNTAYGWGNHASVGYLTGESDPVFSLHAASNVTNGKISNWDTAYLRGNHATKGYITGFTETDPKIGTLVQDKGCYATGGKVVCNQDFTYDEADPVFMANSGNYYPISNPAGYITSATNVWNKSGIDIVNNNTGNVLINKYLNIGASNTLYPLYVWTNNTGDDRANYIAIDGPDSLEKGYQIGAGPTSSDFQRAWYTDNNEGGDKTYFMNGASMRDILTMSAGGRIGINIPTLLGTKTPPDGFSIYPQYFDHVARYDGDTYVDYTSDSYTSAGTPFILVNGPGDTLLLGKENTWRATYVDIATPAGTPGSLVVKYSKSGGTWGDVVGLADTTDKLKKDGNISWSMDSFQSTWEKRTIDGHNLYWIQISLSSLGGAAPTAYLVGNLGVNRFALYNGAGDINPMLTVDSSARLGILPPELTGKYVMGQLPGMTNSQVEIVSNDPLKSDLINYIANDSSEANASILLAKSMGTVDNKAAIDSGDALGGIYGLGYDGGTFRSAASITFRADGNVDVLDMPGKISFFTTPDGDETSLERMTIKNNGRVGIGTTSPTQTLTVSGNINVTNGYAVYDGNGNPYLTTTSLSGYLTGFTESDPIFSAHAAANVTNTKISHWDSAYLRGNHALAGYLTGFTESDPIRSAASINYYSKTQVNDLIAGVRAGMVYQGSRDYSTGVLPSDVHKGDLYEINATGTGYNGLDLYIRDMIIAKQDVTGATAANDRAVIIMDANPNIDPIFTASDAFHVTSSDMADRNTAYLRGNHALAGYLTGETDPVWNLDKTNYYTKNQVDNKISSNAGMSYQGTWDYSTGALPDDPLTGYFYVVTIMGSFSGLTLHTGDMFIANTHIVGSTTTGNRDLIDLAFEDGDPVFVSSPAHGITSLHISNWNTAYGRGNHASMGYLTGETDPTFSASPANNVTNLKISNRDTAYGRGNHASMGYLTNASLAGYLTGGALAPYALLSQTGNWNTAYSRGNHASAGYLTNASLSGYLTGGALAPYALLSQTGNWNTAYSRGNHALAGYLTAETDPIFSASTAANITPTNISNGNTAYGRGNHASMGYLTSYTETDPVWSAASSNYYTKAQITGLGYITASALAPYVLLSQTGNWDTAYSRGNHASAGYLTSASLTNYYTKAQVDGIVVTNSPWIATGSNYYYASGKIGIGLNNPIETLQVLGTARFGGATSYSSFEADGTLVFNGDATVWNDINVGIIGGAGGSSPDLVAINGSVVMAYCYDGGTTVEYAYATAEMQHDRKEGTPFHPHLHMMPSAATAGTGKFTLSYIIIPTNGVATAPVDIALTQYFPAGSSRKGYMPEFPEIMLTGYHVGDQIAFRIVRTPADAADTFTSDVCLNSVGFHYEIDTLGSRLEYTK